MSCLYRALAHFIPGAQTEQLRDMLCEYLATDPDLGGGKASEMVPWETGMQLPNYVQQMRQRGRWGGAIEIKAFCDLFGMNVKVHSFPNRRTIDFVTNKSKSKVSWAEISWTGNHYEPIVRKDPRNQRNLSRQTRANNRHHQLPNILSQTQMPMARSHRHTVRPQRLQGQSSRTRSKNRHKRRRTSSNHSATQQLPQIHNQHQWNQTQPLTHFPQNGGIGPWDQTIQAHPSAYNQYHPHSRGFMGFANTTYHPF